MGSPLPGWQAQTLLLAFVFVVSFVGLNFGTGCWKAMLSASEGIPEKQQAHGFAGGVWDVPANNLKMLNGFSVGHIDPSKFHLYIKVLVYDREESAIRCLRSLESAQYDGDTVSLDIIVDHTFDAFAGKWTKEADDKVVHSHRLLRVLDGFVWSHGEKRVIYRSRNGGIQPQWLEAWWPESVNHFALIVEDDMELSPFYYKYFKEMVAVYYFDPRNYDPHVYGISFQRQSFVPGMGGQPLEHGHGPFLYQVVGTWGQFLFPIPWRDFRIWYDRRRYNSSREPVLGGMHSTGSWNYKKNRIWTPWIIKWTHARHMYNLYASFPGNYSLSVSHRDAGENFNVHLGRDASLIADEAIVRESLPLPPASQLSRHDFCNHILRNGPIAKNKEDLLSMLAAIHKDRSVIMIVVPTGWHVIARNFLCYIEGLDVHHFFFVTQEEDVADDLANRGNAVVLVDSLSLASSASEAQSNGPSHPPATWSLAHAEVVGEVLHAQYDILLSPLDFLWTPSDPLAAFQGLDQIDIIGSIRNRSFGESLLLLHHTDATREAWDHLLTAWQRQQPQPSGSFSSPASASTNKQTEGRVANADESLLQYLLEEGVKYQELWPSDAYRTSPGSYKADDLKDERSAVGRRQAALAGLGLWNLDDYDFVCKQVTCQRQKS